jgi:TetR/AcrR family transcriptional regulator
LTNRSVSFNFVRPFRTRDACKDMEHSATELATDPTAHDGALRILETAENLFSRHGYDGTSINAVAEGAAVSKANVFHHFGSKDDLYLAVLRRACDISAAAMDTLLDGTGSFDERLKRYATRHLETLQAQQAVSRLILREVLEGGSRRARQLVERVFGDHFDKMVAILREGQRQGALRRDLDPAQVAVVLYSVNAFFFQSRSVLDHLKPVTFADDPEGFATAFVDMLLRGIAPPASAAAGTRNRSD